MRSTTGCAARRDCHSPQRRPGTSSSAAHSFRSCMAPASNLRHIQHILQQSIQSTGFVADGPNQFLPDSRLQRPILFK